MICIGFDDLNKPFGSGRVLGPIDGVKKNCGFLAEVGGGPKFGFAVGVVGVPGEKTLPMVLEGSGIKTQWGKVAA